MKKIILSIVLLLGSANFAFGMDAIANGFQYAQKFLNGNETVTGILPFSDRSYKSQTLPDKDGRFKKITTEHHDLTTIDFRRVVDGGDYNPAVTFDDEKTYADAEASKFLVRVLADSKFMLAEGTLYQKNALETTGEALVKNALVQRRVAINGKKLLTGLFAAGAEKHLDEGLLDKIANANLKYLSKLSNLKYPAAMHDRNQQIKALNAAQKLKQLEIFALQNNIGLLQAQVEEGSQKAAAEQQKMKKQIAELRTAAKHDALQAVAESKRLENIIELQENEVAESSQKVSKQKTKIRSNKKTINKLENSLFYTRFFGLAGVTSMGAFAFRENISRACKAGFNYALPMFNNITKNLSARWSKSV